MGDGPLSRRGVGLLLNPYDPIEERIGYGNGIIGFGPYQGSNIVGYTKWGNYNKLPFFSWWKDNNESTGITDGAWFPTSNKAVKFKGRSGTASYLTYYLQITETSNDMVGSGAFRNNYWFYPFPGGGIPGQGGVGNNYLGSHLKYTFTNSEGNWVNPPFDAGTEYCANSSASYLNLQYRDDDFSYWTKRTQTATPSGVLTNSEETVQFPKTYDPKLYGWKEWKTGIYQQDFYWKEDGQPITSNDLFNPEPFEIKTYPRYILARDTDYTPYQISSTDYTIEPKYGLFAQVNEVGDNPYIAFQSPAVNYSFLKDLKTMKIEIFAAMGGMPCTPCYYAGKKVNFVIKYQEGDVTIEKTGNYTTSGNYLEYKFTWGEVKEITKQGTLSGDKDKWIINYPEQSLDSQKLSEVIWDEGELPKGKAKRLVDFYVQSIE
jgi:hypothetical protein